MSHNSDINILLSAIGVAGLVVFILIVIGVVFA